MIVGRDREIMAIVEAAVTQLAGVSPVTAVYSWCSNVQPSLGYYSPMGTHVAAQTRFNFYMFYQLEPSYPS